MFMKEMFTKVALRVADPEEEEVGSEFIHVRIEGAPAVNIISVYLQTGMNMDEATRMHEILQKKVDKCAEMGEECLLMGDMNAPVNPDTITDTASQKFILEWEKSNKVIILNNKSKPTRVPTQAKHQANCLDLGIATPGLESKGIRFTLDENREWTPAKVEPTGYKEKNGDLIYKKTAVSDHMAIEAGIKINIVLPGRSGNIPVINYNTDDGWTKYKKLSDKFAPDIRRIIKTHKDKNERQDAFKELLHKLDIEAFGIKFRKSKSIQKRI